jgi:hypothetical protein
MNKRIFNHSSGEDIMKKIQMFLFATLALLIISPMLKLGSAYYTTDPIGDVKKNGSNYDQPSVDIVNCTITSNSIIISLDNGSTYINGIPYGVMISFKLVMNVTHFREVLYQFEEPDSIQIGSSYYLGEVTNSYPDNNTLSIVLGTNVLEEPTSYSQFNLTVYLGTASDTVGSYVTPITTPPAINWNPFSNLDSTTIGIIVIIGIVVVVLFMKKR